MCRQLARQYEEQMLQLFETYLIPGVEFLRSHLLEIVGSVDSALVMSFLGLMDIRLHPLTYPDGKPPPAPQFLNLIRKYFIFIYIPYSSRCREGTGPIHWSKIIFPPGIEPESHLLASPGQATKEISNPNN